MKLLVWLWRWATYWEVPCEGCDGTGLCAAPGSKGPHSCCGDCDRKTVPAAGVPPGFRHLQDAPTVLVGTGRMWIRPWAPLVQVKKPGRKLPS
jgi:hypothetical protein